MEKQIELEKDLTEIFDEEYEKRHLITPTNTAKKLTEKGYTKQEWISVEDRLPKNNLARFLVFLKDAEFTRPIGFNKIDTDRCIDGKWARWGEYVTHWMPLPQPPKKKEQSDYDL